MLEFYSDVLSMAQTSFLDNLQKIPHHFLSEYGNCCS